MDSIRDMGIIANIAFMLIIDNAGNTKITNKGISYVQRVRLEIGC